MGINDLKKEKVAIKMIDLNRIKQSKSMKTKLKKEIQTMSQLNHSGILRIIDTIKIKEYFCLVLEYASGGDLFELISNHTKVILSFKINKYYRSRKTKPETCSFSCSQL